MIEEPLSLEVTTECNSLCSHCFVSSQITHRSTLCSETAEQIICEAFCCGYRHLHITGGEPFLWKPLLCTLSLAFDLGFQTVFINTNGTLLTDRICSEISCFPDLTLSISLDGTLPIHDRVRGRGRYHQTTTGISNALSAGIRVVIFTTVGKTLLKELPYYVRDLYRSFPRISYLSLIQLIRVKHAAFTLSQELLNPLEFIRLVQMVALLNAYGLKIDILNNPLARTTAKLLGLPWRSCSHSIYKSGRLTLMSTEDLTLSHSSCGSFAKYQPGMLQQVLHSESYTSAVSAATEPCFSCSHHSICTASDMLRPTEYYRNTNSDTLYCQNVLDLASSTKNHIFS